MRPPAPGAPHVDPFDGDGPNTAEPNVPAAAPLRALSIVMPAHDEAESIDRAVTEAVTAGRLCATELEVLVVDDGSRDATASRLEALAERYPELRVVRHETNRGYGAALRTGLTSARCEWVFYTDADGQFDVAELPLLIAALGRYDVVTGYRRDRRDGPLRLALGRAWTGVTNRCFGLSVRDVNCAFKIYPRALFERATLSSDGALVDAEILSEATRLGYRIGEVGVTHLPRLRGEASGVRPKVAMRAVRELLALTWRRAQSGARQSAQVESPGRP